jgi:TPP-dependent pyruvate/acetoin dehydrogenase alpha subunit
MDVQELLTAYRTMRLIRSFEDTVVTLVNANEIPGVTHEYIGQEAVATGMCAAMTPDDVLTSTHRGHGHLIARGADPGRMFAELMAREDGLNHGRGGSMHVADVSLGIFGANGIVGAGAPFAAGAASVPGPSGPRVAVAFFGDGAINQGVLLETFNLAAAWNLPMVFCCENNGYAVTTPAAKSSKVTPLQRATGFGLVGREVDGMDIEAVYEAAQWAVDHARSGAGPVFLDCRCYRFVGHNTGEHTLGLTYRTTEEIEDWRLRDPLVSAALRLAKHAELGPAAVDDVDDSVVAEIERATAFARGSANPSPESAMDFMYATETLTTATRWGTR